MVGGRHDGEHEQYCGLHRDVERRCVVCFCGCLVQAWVLFDSLQTLLVPAAAAADMAAEAAPDATTLLPAEPCEIDSLLARCDKPPPHMTTTWRRSASTKRWRTEMMTSDNSALKMYILFDVILQSERRDSLFIDRNMRGLTARR